MASKILNHSLVIAHKDLLEFSRSKMRLVMLIVMPLFMMIMVGFIFPSGSSISDVPLAFANLDDGVGNVSLGDAFGTQFEVINDQAGLFEISPGQDLEDMKQMIRKGQISGGIVIPNNFTQTLLNGEQATIIIITDQSNPQLSMQVQGALAGLVDAMGTMAANQALNTTYGIPAGSTIAIIEPYTIEVTGIIPGDPSYFQFVAPGIMAMVVMMALMTGLPHAISYEKDIGTLDGMLVAPIKRTSIVLGKVLAQTTRGMIQGMLILILAMVLFGVVLYGSIILVIGLMLLSVFSFVGLGILVTSFSQNEETASMMMMSLMFPMMFLSGVFFPVEQMPSFMQTISSALPMTYAVNALRKVMILGADISAIGGEVLILIGFGIALLAISVPMFKKAMCK